MLESIDGHIIDKKDLILRPGATRRISFRGTPGGKVSVRIFAKRGPNLGDNEDPVDPSPGGRVIGAFEGAAERDFQLSSRRGESLLRIPKPNSAKDKHNEQVIEAQILTASKPDGANNPGVSFLDNNPAGRSIISFDNINDIVVIPNPNPNPPLIIQQSMRVQFRVRDGVTFHDETTQPNPNGHPGRITISSNHTFIGHDIIDIIFTNPNSFPVIFSSFINVQNDLTISTTTLPGPLTTRLLEDALLLLAPSFGIRDGKLFFSFNEEVEGFLDSKHEPVDIGIDLDASVIIKPVKFKLLSNEEVIRTMAEEVEAEIRKQSQIFPGFNLTDSIPDDFVTQFVNTFFSNGQLPDLLNSMGLNVNLWAGALFSRPLLTGNDDGGVIQEYKKGRRNDAAIKFSLELSEIIAGTSRLEVNVDTITADLYIVLRNGRTFIPHPTRELIDDKIPTGTLFPRFQLKVDISKIDVDLNLGDNVISNTIEFFAEKGLETIASYLKDDFEGAAVDEGMKFLDANIQQVGELASEMMIKIANRDHILQKVSANSNGDWIIETLNPSQLAVPFEEEDLVDHRFDNISINEEPVQPIDGLMTALSTNQLGKVTNLVFLMMENRSFDHMLGYLSHPNHGARTDLDGLNGQAISVGGTFEGTTATPQSSPRLEFSPNPGHNAESVAVQVNNGAMDGFVSEFDRRIQADDEINPNGNQNDPFRILKFHTAEDVHIYEDLSKSSLILDRWFCSIPGGTYPNRSCYYSGITPFMKNSEIFNDAGYLPHLTLFDVMDKQGVDWKIFESSVSFLRMYDNYRLENVKIRPIEELTENERPILPSVTFIDPDFKGSTGCPNDDHAPTNIKEGQNFIDRVIKSLKRNPNWGTTMLVIIYDEHGGFADHVPPPGTSASDFPPDTDGKATVPLAHPDAGSYGVRIPAIVVSPLVRAGTVGHKIYDHATVYKTILEKFMPQIRNSKIVPERVRQSRHLGEIISDNLLANPPEVLANPATVQPPGDTQPPVGPSPGNLAPDATVLANPDRLTTAKCKPDAILRNDSDDVRPYNATAEYKDFHEFMTRLGHPIDKE